MKALSDRWLRTGQVGDVLVDLRNIYQQREADAVGFRYASIGRGGTPSASHD